MMTPRSPSSLGGLRAISAAARRSTLKVPVRLTAITQANSSSGIGPCLLTVRMAAPMPAQLTHTCTAPKRSTAFATAAWTSSALVTSAGSKRAGAPSRRATSSPADPGRSRMTALPPFSIIISTVASPRPDAPPVTSATAPASFMGRLHSQIGRPTPGEACAGAAHRGDSGPMRLEARGHPLHTRALSVVLAARADGKLDVHGAVLDLRKRGFVPVAGDLQGAGVIHDMRLAGTIDPASARLETLAAEQRSVAFEPSAVTGGERFAEQLEVRLVVEVEFPALTIGRLEAAERRRGAADLEDAAWRARGEAVAWLVGRRLGGGITAELLARLGGAPDDRPLLDTLLMLAPALVQCAAAMSEAWPLAFRTDPSVVAMGGLPDSCYMWRRDGALDRARAAEGNRPPWRS